MSKTITVSDETYEKIKKQIEEDKQKEYPVASISLSLIPWLILNLPDSVLTEEYKGMLLCIDETGELIKTEPKSSPMNSFYFEEMQVFPPLEESDES